MPTRRPRKTIGIEDVTGEIDEVMTLLISMKNDNQSYDMIAESLTTEHTIVSAPLVRKVALGLCRSPKIEAALGLREETATVPLDMVRKNKPPSKWPKRPGIFIGCDEATRASFDSLRLPGESRGACLERLMLLAMGLREVV